MEQPKQTCTCYESDFCLSRKLHPSLAERRRVILISEINGISLVADTMFCLARTPEVQRYCTGYTDQQSRRRA